MKVVHVTELVLGANAKLSDVVRMKWKTSTMDNGIDRSSLVHHKY